MWRAPICHHDTHTPRELLVQAHSRISFSWNKEDDRQLCVRKKVSTVFHNHRCCRRTLTLVVNWNQLSSFSPRLWAIAQSFCSWVNLTSPPSQKDRRENLDTTTLTINQPSSAWPWPSRVCLTASSPPTKKEIWSFFMEGSHFWLIPSLLLLWKNMACSCAKSLL